MWKGINTTIAIIAICILVLCALKAGYNGLILTGGVAAIAGLGGFATGRLKRKNDETKKKK